MALASAKALPGSGGRMKNSMDLSLCEKGNGKERELHMHMWASKLLCFTHGYNFKSRFVKAGHEQVRNRKCILFLYKTMIIKKKHEK